MAGSLDEPAGSVGDAINSGVIRLGVLFFDKLSIRIGELVESVGQRHAGFKDNLIDLATQLQIMATAFSVTAAASSAGTKVLRFSSIRSLISSAFA